MLNLQALYHKQLVGHDITCQLSRVFTNDHWYLTPVLSRWVKNLLSLPNFSRFDLVS